MRPSFTRFFRVAIAGLFLAWPLVGLQAALITNSQIIVSRQQPSTASNFEIQFVSPTGVESSSDTIALSFPSGYDLSTLTFGDIDLSHGPTTGLETGETLAAAAAIGIWGVSISGNIITFTAPTNAAAGEIAAADFVVISLGTNASAGTNQIVNPASTGNAILGISGTFGDTGGIDLYVGGNDYLTVTATIPGSAGGGTGGGGGPPSADGTPPTIFDVMARDITQTTVNITWQTSESADSEFSYGLTIEYASGTVSDVALSIDHTFPLDGLTPDTVYHFFITAKDAIGNTARTGDYTFRTLPVPRPPTISNLRVVSITDTSAVVLWETDIPATSEVEFGTGLDYGRTESVAGLTTEHSVILFGLIPGTSYHYRALSSEATGLETVSGDQTFTTTLDDTPPTNVFGFVATPGNALNRLDWSNPSDPDFSFVRIVARTDRFPTDPTDGRLVYEGSAATYFDAGLENGVTYYYANFAYDATGNRASGAFASATPSEDLPVTPPPVPVPTPVPGPTPAPGPGPVVPGPTPGPSPVPSPIPVPGTIPTPGTAPIIGPMPSPLFPVLEPEPELPQRPGTELVPVYLGARGSVELTPDVERTVGSLVGSSVTVRIPVAGLGGIPSEATIIVGGSTYALSPVSNGTALEATFVPSMKPGLVPVRIRIVFPDGTGVSTNSVIRAFSYGTILGRDLPILSAYPLSGAKVTLYRLTNGEWRIWDGARFSQANPYITGDNGAYGFTVANGSYRLIVERDGYLTQERELMVTRNVIVDDITLAASLGVFDVLQSEQAKAVAISAAPIVIAVAAANLATTASLFSIFNYLRFLLTQPALLVRRMRRQKWGVVYNALSKKGVDLVAVRLIHVKTGLIIQTRITDSMGRFSFRAKPGIYRLEAKKAGFLFPSAVLKDDKTDTEYLDLYHGEQIEVKETSDITPNIPLDPQVKEETPRSILWKQRLRRFQALVGSLSVWLSLLILIVLPSVFMLALFVFQIGLFLLFKRLAKGHKPKGWGIVYDRETRLPLAKAIVRIFDKKSNKLLETQITDAKGAYGFFVGKNIYFVTSQLSGYASYTSEALDLTQADKAMVDQHIGLKKVEVRSSV